MALLFYLFIFLYLFYLICLFIYVLIIRVKYIFGLYKNIPNFRFGPPKIFLRILVPKIFHPHFCSLLSNEANGADMADGVAMTSCHFLMTVHI